MIIQMSDLNDDRFGRFGNQLFKFFFLKILEKEIGVEIRHPNWLGNIAFNLKQTAPTVQDCEVLVFDPSREWTLNDAINVIKKQKNNKAIDIKGFFQFHSSEFLPYIDLFKNVFTLNDSLKKIINAALEKHKAKGTNIISIHMRRGDYENYSNNPLFWTTPTDSILNSLRSIKSSNFQKELIYIASDNISCCKQEFDSAGIEYITADDLFAFEDENTRLLVDFTIFSTAQACIISNSSLSFFGSLMNKESKIFLRPLPDENILTPYAPWNSSVLLRKSF